MGWVWALREGSCRLGMKSWRRRCRKTQLRVRVQTAGEGGADGGDDLPYWIAGVYAGFFFVSKLFPSDAYGD